MILLPISNLPEENTQFLENPWHREICQMTLDHYQRVGYAPPWIGYMVMQDGEIVGTGGFKGRPINGSVEIAYGTEEAHQKKGVGTAICSELVLIAQHADPGLEITACTLPENNFSTRILEKNRFEFVGTIQDPEDGEVWKWVYKG